MALTAGVVSLVSVTDIGAALISTAAVSGTTPYTYQWYRATSSGFTPGTGNAIAAATALSLSDSGLSSRTRYYYKLKSVDSNATPATVTSNQLLVTTLAPQNQLSINNVINISVATPQTGLGEYNTSNVAIFSDDAYDSVGFGSLGYKIYLSPIEVGEDFGTSSKTYAMALGLFSQQPNILANGGYLVVIPFENGESYASAIARMVDVVQFFGMMSTTDMSGAEVLAAAAVIQSLTKMGLFIFSDEADVAPGGDADDLRTGGFSKCRGLFYSDTASYANYVMMASYAGLGFSTNFNGSNTTQTLHLKGLSGVQPDPTMDQTLLELCQAAGADVYVSIQGVSKIFCSGENGGFFDDIYDLYAFVGDLEVAEFNVLATAGTKIPQTEGGMNILKGAARKICEQYVANQFLAPGEWNSSVFFGDQQDLIDNVRQRGYYIYSSPVSQQSAADRADRVAPLIQIALKYAGAIHSATVIVNVNA